ncbi:MAG: helix-turn-helix domain-containing protein [Salinibacter sp.]
MHLLDVPARDEPFQVGGLPKLQLALFRAEGHLRTWRDHQPPHIDGQIRPGDFLISPPALVGAPLKSYVTRRAQGTDIFFEPEMIAKACRACDLDPDAVEFDLTSTHPSVKQGGGRQVDADSMVERLAWTLSEELATGAPSERIYAEHLMLTLAVHLLTEYAAVEADVDAFSGGIPPVRLRRVKNYVEAHLGEDISLGDLARQAGMSEYHFSRQFKREEGVSPYRYVIRRRVEKAKELLRDTGHTVAEVARQVGYATPARPAVQEARRHLARSLPRSSVVAPTEAPIRISTSLNRMVISP